MPQTTLQGEIVADLHMHSTDSDGCLSAHAMVEASLQAGLRCFAITDHDTLDGTVHAREAFEVAARDAEALLVPGVEVSTQTDGRGVHVLGYFIDVDAPCLVQVFEQNRSSRIERACMVADNLAEDGYPVNGELLRLSGETINRTLIARMLVDAGYAASVDDAYERLIGRSTKYYVENVKFPTVEAVHLIHEAGGYPFIAHPAHYGVSDLIPSLVDEGLSGLEAFHTLQTAVQSEQLVHLAQDLGIGVSGGSDWHGDDTHGSRLASAGLDTAGVESFLSHCDRSL